MKKSQWALTLRITLSLSLIGIVLLFVDFREVANAAANMNIFLLVAAVTALYLDRALMAYKWQLLLVAAHVRVPLFVLFQTYMIAPMTAIILPSTIGGDIFRLYNLSRFKVNVEAVIASVIVERLIGFVATLALASVSLGLGFYVIREHVTLFGSSWLIILLIGAATVIGLFGLAYGFSRQLVVRIVERYSGNRIVRKLRQIYTVSFQYRKQPRAVGVVYAWTLLEQIAPIILNLLLVRALHIDVSLLELFLIMPLIMLAIRLPISLDGIGVQEGLYLATFGLAGVSASEALLLSTMNRVVIVFSALPWAMYYILRVRKHALVEHGDS